MSERNEISNKFLLFGFCLLLLTGSALAEDSGLGPSLELVCPCVVESVSSGSVLSDFGVTNRSVGASGELVVRAYAHTEQNYRDATDPTFLTDFYLTASLAGTSQLDISEHQARLFPVSGGDYYVTLLLLEDLFIVDEARTSGRVTFGSNLRTEASGTELYFVADPTISVNDASVTLHWPGLGNGTNSDEDVEVRIVATETPRFEGSFQTLATYDGVTSVPALSKTAPDVAVLDYASPSEGFDYTHVMVLGGGFVLIVHTVDEPDGVSYDTLSFSESNADYLTDTDGDGVADDNERLEGTDVSSPSDTPGSSAIDVLVVYNQGVVDTYSGDPTARIDQLFAVSNRSLADSNVDIELRITDYRQIDFSERDSLSDLLGAAEGGTGVFSDLASIRSTTGSDLVAILRTDDGGNLCGLASLGGFPTQGLMSRREHVSTSIIESTCGDLTMIHEIGHNLGLGHSFVQNESGTFVWSRGHGVNNSFSTIMAYASEFNIFSESAYFSNPEVTLCEAGAACGVAIDQNRPADAARSLNAVRFQVARYTNELDSDSDGTPDSADAFPNDPTEQIDTDLDGTGNNADTDDDNDGMPDTFELANGLNSLVDDASEDPDGDGLTNLEEFQGGTDPQVSDAADVCDDPDTVAPDASDSNFMNEKRIVFANPGSNSNQQTFLRFVNHNASATDVEIYGIDDAGVSSRRSPVSFQMAAQSSKQITAQDLESGNQNKGLSSSLCDLSGKWQLVVRSSNSIEVMSLIRTPDGFLTGLSDVVPVESGDNRVYFANPASNTSQQTFIRISNQSASTGSVTVTGIDDHGDASIGTVTFSLGANESKQVTAQDLENGNVSKGLSGALGDGSGKWQLNISSSLDLEVLSLIRTADGFLTNLSAVVPENGNGDSVIYFANPGKESTKSTFIRVVNTSALTANVTISGVDDDGNIAPNGDVTFTLAGKAAKQMLSSDLEDGNANKGLSGSLGQGSGRWQLTVAADQEIRVMSLVRTPDGFLTNLSRVAPQSGNNSALYIVNPGSNQNQASSLRFVNASNNTAAVSVNGFDDNGAAAPGGGLSFNLGAGEALTLTAAELESGATGVVGSLGDGSGKWFLTVEADEEVTVQSLLNAPGGFLTNLSRAISE
ncbi:MAG: hypothetical protein JJ957_14705 [Pseudomonadales bacterium]|nr:hypothetical protein [Pseudomonadales bacterium]MBO6565521.1 hypothetical protein [Pseudomonadales bacterium]MBO6597031.1 hypothetical protein [Pseudomonadales bacterium]MBO6823783.1 hypothetical protein [Pseudomonadales bacterium]